MLQGHRPLREPSLDGNWLKNLMEHEMALLDEASGKKKKLGDIEMYNEQGHFEG